MLQIAAGNIIAYLSYCIAINNELIILSDFHKSSLAINGISACLSLGNEPVRILEDGRVDASFNMSKAGMESYSFRTRIGWETIYQGASISNKIGRDYIFVRKERAKEDLYAFLMNNFEYPLLREWCGYLLARSIELGYMERVEADVYGSTDLIEAYDIYICRMGDEDFAALISEGLARRNICIAEDKQEPLIFHDMDEYFGKYGHTLVDNLEKIIQPLCPLKDKVEEAVFMNKRLFPQQSAIVNGAVEALRHKKYVFLIQGMGCGKTLQSLGVAEAFFQRYYLEKHPEYTVKDLYMNSSLINYRVILMCPSHLVDKWARTIKEEVPYAKVEILTELKQLVKLKKKGRKAKGKEYYVLSKDTGKLAYAYRPVPDHMAKKRIAIPVCKKCGEEAPADLKDKCSCGCANWEVKYSEEWAYGLVCPECGELLLPAGRRLPDEGEVRVLLPEDFAVRNTHNNTCRCCGTSLWAPSCKPRDDRILFYDTGKKKGKWKKISHFSNRAQKGRKTVWVMRNRERLYLKQNKITEEEVEEMDEYGPRRYSLTRFIKKQMKGYFDLAIFDEVQEYKAGGSAQGYSMADLICASRWQLALTGTIAGGYASDLFYTLYRLDPKRMKSKGYLYGSKGERRFIEKYGTVETVYELDEDIQFHSMSRGKAVVPFRCLPGISVMIFIDFLMDTALFLDLSDLSRYLPHLYEYVRFVPLEPEIRCEYVRIRHELKDTMKEDKKEKVLMGSYLQFSLSYTDMPYKRGPILSPVTGDIVAEPADFSELIAEGKLLNKEREIVEIICKEQEEGRNCFIYCEYTGGDDAVTYRLKEVVEKNCNLAYNEVTVMESSNPPAVEREEWMHQKAMEGTRVFISNAKCVATGLDFAFHYLGKDYNYPTIIFFQTGYDMIKIWQASRRHYRLNQTMECRTYYIVSENTLQPDVVEMIANKEAATSAIQGQFSSEGLTAMARGLDPRVALAQSVAEQSEAKKRGLQQMMDVINIRNNQGKEAEEYREAPIFSELTGMQKAVRADDLTANLESMDGVSFLEFLGFAENTGDETEVEEKIVELPQEHINYEQEGYTKKSETDLLSLLGII